LHPDSSTRTPIHGICRSRRGAARKAPRRCAGKNLPGRSSIRMSWTRAPRAQRHASKVGPPVVVAAVRRNDGWPRRVRQKRASRRQRHFSAAVISRPSAAPATQRTLDGSPGSHEGGPTKNAPANSLRVWRGIVERGVGAALNFSFGSASRGHGRRRRNESRTRVVGHRRNAHCAPAAR
jgi:hypothetical protein